MISNATPLIHLAKINQLNLLKDLFNKIIIPEAVEKEVLIEDKEGYSVIKDAINNKWIKIKDPKNNLELGRGNGENSAISLAKEENDQLLIDDNTAIKIANSFGVKCLRTTAIILLTYKKKLIDNFQAKKLIYELIESGYYVSPRVLSELLKLIDSS